MTITQSLNVEQLSKYENLVITQPNCPFCVKAKALLEQRNVDFTTLVLGTDLDKTVMIDFIEQVANLSVRTVPQIILDGHYIGGHDDLVAFYERQVEDSNFDDFEL